MSVLTKKQKQTVEIFQKILGINAPSTPANMTTSSSSSSSTVTPSTLGVRASATRINSSDSSSPADLNRNDISSINGTSPPSSDAQVPDLLMEEKKRFLAVKTSSEKAAKLQKAIKGTAFSILKKKTQTKITKKWVETLLSSDDENDSSEDENLNVIVFFVIT